MIDRVIEGQALRGRREALGLTQEKAAGLLGVKQSYLSRLENARVPVSGARIGALMSGYDRIEERLLGERAGR